MSASLKLSPEVRAVLDKATITATSVRLNTILPRKLCEQVNQVLEAAGGKWVPQRKVHEFSGDPRQLLGLLTDDYSVVKGKTYFTVVGLFPDGERYCRTFLEEQCEHAEREALRESRERGRDYLLIAGVIAGAHTSLCGPRLLP